jgi:hypothetical protein
LHRACPSTPRSQPPSGEEWLHGALAGLDQEQEPERASGEAGSREGLGKDMALTGENRMLKSPLPESTELFRKVQESLGPDRLPLLIAIDGSDGVGKSSLASWLAWQLGAPAIHLDLYLVRGSDPLRWRSDDLRRVVETRLNEHANPIIVEGILILDALDKIGRKPDFLVYVEGEGGHSLSTRLADYKARRNPEQQSHFRLHGFSEMP